MNESNVCIVIPLYKPNPNHYEIASLKQCLQTLFSYDVCFACSNNLNLDLYQNCITQISNKINLQIVSFDNSFFESIDGYNKLMLSISFYSRFLQYRYILIYQLDAWIFKDELNDWCNKNYDYVGAPWINWLWSEHFAKYSTLPRRIITKLGYKKHNLVGNGGFSLRKVDTIICNLKVFKKQALSYTANEDYFFSFWLTSYNPFFKIPLANEALKFSFDENPALAFAENDYKLPMGCHAWPKHLDFWKEYIN